jgi:hypothetical protein
MSDKSEQVARAIEESRTKRDALLWLLSDGAWHTQEELAQVAGYRYGARVLDLRKRGLKIEKQRLGPRQFFYRLLAGGGPVRMKDDPTIPPRPQDEDYDLPQDWEPDLSGETAGERHERDYERFKEPR